MLLAVTQRGGVVLAEARRERFHELGHMRPNIEIGTPRQPTITSGRMYLRGAKAVACCRVHKKSD